MSATEPLELSPPTRALRGPQLIPVSAMLIWIFFAKAELASPLTSHLWWARKHLVVNFPHTGRLYLKVYFKLCFKIFFCWQYCCTRRQKLVILQKELAAPKESCCSTWSVDRSSLVPFHLFRRWLMPDPLYRDYLAPELYPKERSCRYFSTVSCRIFQSCRYIYIFPEAEPALYLNDLHSE